MKLIGTKEKGYKLVSSFEQRKKGKTEESESTTPPKSGTTGPDKGGKEK